MHAVNAESRVGIRPANFSAGVYTESMRHLVLALMIVLLPLRGWAGDAMVTQTASAVISTETGFSHAYETLDRTSFNDQNQTLVAAPATPDCHEQVASHQETDQTASNDHCGTCLACQACHTVGVLSSPLEVSASFTSPSLRPSRAVAFTSAASALGQKPPIS
jgi:hypothetical protein